MKITKFSLDTFSIENHKIWYNCIENFIFFIFQRIRDTPFLPLYSQVVTTCFDGTLFQQSIQSCDWAANVDCDSNGQTTDPPATTEPPTTEEPTVDPGTTDPPVTDPGKQLEKWHMFNISKAKKKCEF